MVGVLVVFFEFESSIFGILRDNLFGLSLTPIVLF